MTTDRDLSKVNADTASFQYSVRQPPSIAGAFLPTSYEVGIDDVDDTPQIRLSRGLSINSIISRASLFAAQQRDSTEESQSFRSIGLGLCAEIFHQPGTDTVLKRAHDRSDIQLWNDSNS